MTDAEVLAAIRAKHLKANIAYYEGRTDCTIRWDEAWLEPLGSVSYFGTSPYAHVPVYVPGDGRAVIRVYPPERLRKRLAREWTKGDGA